MAVLVDPPAGLFFDRIADWDDPNAPVRPPVFIGDLPIVDKPLPRFLDDGAATKLLRAARADTDPLAMTIVYARIADRTVAEQYFSVTEKVGALYGRPPQLPDTDEGSEMRKLRAEMHRRMLGNRYGARAVDMACHFESICESCSFFVTTIEFRPTLQAQRDGAAHKGRIGRTKVFDGLLERLDSDAS